ncbi:hypothetical protein DPMN_050072 [Dreissena polymorpha]|uniref:Uncharacterized protein n=1 Tax=Dreissena polymorpha TaxID=45954 RepID=A0A9D4HKZ8_DREPO|nr:hypothetical protein DPMN_050072 [Dreissena polymorpha]
MNCGYVTVRIWSKHGTANTRLDREWLECVQTLQLWYGSCLPVDINKRKVWGVRDWGKYLSGAATILIDNSSSSESDSDVF